MPVELNEYRVFASCVTHRTRPSRETDSQDYQEPSGIRSPVHSLQLAPGAFQLLRRSAISGN